MENKKNPFFSIVIPTKNRPEYLGDSIQSALLQNFDDFEVIVSDNFNDPSTAEVIKEFSSNKRFHSFRTSEEMNMINHWEFASRKANGKYVILLTDRKLLFQGALKKVHRTIIENPEINAFSFGVKVYNDLEKKMGWNVPLKPTKIYRSKELIQNFLSTNYFSKESLDFVYPKTLNGCYKNSFAKTVREVSGSYFSNDGVTTPDYSSLFINLALTEEVMYIGEKLILQQGEQTSNGRHFGAGKYESYMESLGLVDPYKLVPIKAPFIYNLLHVDFWTIRNLFKGSLQPFSLDWDNFFKTNYWELLEKKRINLPDVDLTYFEKCFNEALEENIDRIETFSKQSVLNKYSSPQSKDKFNKITNLKSHLKDFVSYRFPNNKWASKALKIHYKSSLHAAGFKF